MVSVAANPMSLGLGNNGSDWVKTRRGWVLRQLDSVDLQPSAPSSVYHGALTPQKHCQATQQRPVTVKGTKGQRRVVECLSELIKILDLKGAALDTRRATYLHELMSLLMTNFLGKVSGTTHRQLFQILEIMVNEALSRELHIGRIKTLLVSTLRTLKDGLQGRIGCSTLWNRHIQTVSNLSTKVEQFRCTQREDDGLPQFTDLPKEVIMDIMLRFTNHRDLINLGSTCADLNYMSEDPMLWERLTQYHFTEKQMLTFLDSDDYGEVTDWANTYTKCYKKFGLKRTYADILVICSACKCLHWLIIGHDCWNMEEGIRNMDPVTPEEFMQIINL